MPHTGSALSSSSASGNGSGSVSGVAGSAQQLSSLGSLYRTIDARLASFKKLLKLQGRLQLILAQVNRRHGGALISAAAGEDSDAAVGAITTYDEASAKTDDAADADADAAGDSEADGEDGDLADDGEGDSDSDSIGSEDLDLLS